MASVLFRHLNLSWDSQEVYLAAKKRRMVLWILNIVTYVVLYKYYTVNNITNWLDSRAAFFLIFTVFLLFADMLYVVTHGQTYWQLLRRDVAKGRNESKQMLDDMQGIAHGKK